MKGIKFLNHPKLYNPDNAFVVHISGGDSNISLFKQLYVKLKFPDYFGFNWDALDECLRDLQWIEQREIVLVHDDMPKLSEKELKIYLDILVYAIEDWQHFRDQQDWQNWIEHKLEVVFPESAMEWISSYRGTSKC